MWLYFTNLAEELNERGLETRAFLESGLIKKIRKFADWLVESGNINKYYAYCGKKLIKILDAHSNQVDIPWNKNTVHDLLWVPIQKAMTGKESTTELESPDPSEIYEVLNRHLAQKFGVSVRWPSEEL